MFISARKNDYDKRFEECIVFIVYIRIYVVSNLRLKYKILVLIYKLKIHYHLLTLLETSIF